MAAKSRCSSTPVHGVHSMSESRGKNGSQGVVAPRFRHWRYDFWTDKVVQSELDVFCLPPLNNSREGQQVILTTIGPVLR